MTTSQSLKISDLTRVQKNYDKTVAEFAATPLNQLGPKALQTVYIDPENSSTISNSANSSTVFRIPAGTYYQKEGSTKLNVGLTKLNKVAYIGGTAATHNRYLPMWFLFNKMKIQLRGIGTEEYTHLGFRQMISALTRPAIPNSFFKTMSDGYVDYTPHYANETAYRVTASDNYIEQVDRTTAKGTVYSGELPFGCLFSDANCIIPLRDHIQVTLSRASNDELIEAHGVLDTNYDAPTIANAKMMMTSVDSELINAMVEEQLNSGNGVSFSVPRLITMDAQLDVNNTTFSFTLTGLETAILPAMIVFGFQNDDTPGDQFIEIGLKEYRCSVDKQKYPVEGPIYIDKEGPFGTMMAYRELQTAFSARNYEMSISEVEYAEPFSKKRLYAINLSSSASGCYSVTNPPKVVLEGKFDANPPADSRIIIAAVYDRILHQDYEGKFMYIA